MRHPQIVVYEPSVRIPEGVYTPWQKPLLDRLPDFWRRSWLQRGWAIRLTLWPADAISAVSEDTPTILLTYPRRDRLEGLKLLERTCRLLPDVSVVALFDTADLGLIDWCWEIGVSAVLVGRNIWDELDELLVSLMNDNIDRMRSAFPASAGRVNTANLDRELKS